MSAADDPRAQPSIEEQASLWFAQQRLSADAFEHEAFQAWLGADERHRQAYARVARAAELLDSVREADVLPHSLRPRRFGRSWIAPVAAAAAVAAATLLFVFGGFTPQARYETGVAEVETFTLPDGSLATLGPASRIEVRFSERSRRISLASGEAFFDVTHDAARRFSVDAGDATVVVTGTQFDVRRSDGVVRVAVARGAVQVEAASALSLGAPATARLRAGEQVEAPERVGLFARPAPLVLTRLSPGSAGAWREGHLSYIEAPLSELVADLNRYYAPGVRLSDPDLGQFRLTASFRVDDLDTFLSTLPEAAPVRLTRGPDDEVIISPASAH